MGDSSSFDSISYANFTQYKKFLFCVTPDNLFMSFLLNHKVHVNIHNNSLNNLNGSSGPNKSSSNLKPSPSKTSEPIIINTHFT